MILHPKILRTYQRQTRSQRSRRRAACLLTSVVQLLLPSNHSLRMVNRLLLYLYMSVILRNPAAEALSPSARKKVAVIGGGIAGLTCAKHIDKNFDVTVFDTGRLRPGGRASSRLPGDKPKDPDDRREFLSQCIVDHAAQVLAVSSGMSNFAEQIRVWEQQGVVAPFPPASLYAITADEKGPIFMNLSDQYYAVGGMSQLSRALCRDASFDVRQNQWVSPSNGVRFIEKMKQWKVQGCTRQS